MTRKADQPPGKTRLPQAFASESRGVRTLHLETPWVQGAMRVSQPLRLELSYIRRMMAWMLFHPATSLSAPALARWHSVHLGLGAASLTKFTHQVLGMHTTAVELNPAVIALCRTVFGLGDDGGRLQVLQTDAGAWLAEAAQAAPGRADVVFADLYDREAAAPVFDSPGFYADARAVLADDHGLLCVNLFGRQAVFARSVSAIAEAFGPGRVFALPPTREGNRVVVASKALPLPSKAVLAQRGRRLQKQWGALGLDAAKWAETLGLP
jgi:spermidine synthase